MTLSAFTPSVAPDIEAVIQSRLTALETVHDVRIPFAIEGGSRAWGFASSASDNDVRFVYAHQPEGDELFRAIANGRGHEGDAQ